MENDLILNIWYLWLHTGHWSPDWVITGCQRIIWLPPYTDFCTSRLFCTCPFLHVCVFTHKTDIALPRITLSTMFYWFCTFSFIFAHLQLPQGMSKKIFSFGTWGIPLPSLEKGFLWVHTTGICHLAFGCTMHTTDQTVAQPYILVFSIFRCTDNYYLLGPFCWVSIKWLSDVFFGVAQYQFPIHQGSGSRIRIEDWCSRHVYVQSLQASKQSHSENTTNRVTLWKNGSRKKLWKSVGANLAGTFFRSVAISRELSYWQLRAATSEIIKGKAVNNKWPKGR